MSYRLSRGLSPILHGFCGITNKIQLVSRPNPCPERHSPSDMTHRLKRVFAIEIEKCEKCGGKVKIIACIEDPEVIQKILKRLGLDEASQTRNRSPPVGLFSVSGQLF